MQSNIIRLVLLFSVPKKTPKVLPVVFDRSRTFPSVCLVNTNHSMRDLRDVPNGT